MNAKDAGKTKNFFAYFAGDFVISNHNYDNA